MNSFKRRIRNAYRAFQEKPSGSITFGVDVRNCRDCHRGDCETCGFKIHSEGVSKLPDCNNCGKRIDCQYLPRLGEYARINCPLWVEMEDLSNENH